MIHMVTQLVITGLRRWQSFRNGIAMERDVPCRYGGHEYVVLHKGLSDISVLESKVIRFARKLQRKAMEKGQNVHCSAGICQINGSGFSTEECMNVADTALYEAKKKGKNARDPQHQQGWYGQSDRT